MFFRLFWRAPSMIRSLEAFMSGRVGHARVSPLHRITAHPVAASNDVRQRHSHDAQTQRSTYGPEQDSPFRFLRPCLRNGARLSATGRVGFNKVMSTSVDENHQFVLGMLSVNERMVRFTNSGSTNPLARVRIDPEDITQKRTKASMTQPTLPNDYLGIGRQLAGLLGSSLEGP